MSKIVEWLNDRVGYLHNVQLYMQRMNIRRIGPIHEGSYVFSFPSLTQLQNDIDQANILQREFTELFQQKGDISGFNSGDVSYGAYMKSPGHVIKRGGSYNDRGYPTYLEFFFKGPHNKFYSEVPGGDAKGFYFHGLGNSKIYYYKFQADSEEEDDQELPSAQPVPKTPPPKKTSSKAKRAKPKTKKTPIRAPTVSQIGSSHKLLPKKGHGLSRLIAEAKDPPIVELTGTVEGLKSFRKRHKTLTCSTTYKLREKHRLIVEFKTFPQREKFLQEVSLRTLSYRLGSFATWQ